MVHLVWLQWEGERVLEFVELVRENEKRKEEKTKKRSEKGTLSDWELRQDRGVGRDRIACDIH